MELDASLWRNHCQSNLTDNHYCSELNTHWMLHTLASLRFMKAFLAWCRHAHD